MADLSKAWMAKMVSINKSRKHSREELFKPFVSFLVSTKISRGRSVERVRGLMSNKPLMQ